MEYALDVSVNSGIVVNAGIIVLDYLHCEAVAQSFMGQFYYTYVLYSLKDNKLYIGYTNNIERRFQEHQDGKNTSTANRRPLNLIYYEAHLTKEDALRRESYFKTSSGKRTLKLMLRESLSKLDNIGLP